MLAGDTIVAISSAVGAGARIIVRISGPDAPRIAANICCPGAGAALTGLLFGGLEARGWVYHFAAPRSYSGEDLIEFHIPGSPVLARMLMAHILSLGARAAEAGEFTARAYFSGRMDLTEAEGVAATIAAQSSDELRAARQLTRGELARRIRPVMDELADLLALVEAQIDFDDQEISPLPTDQIAHRIPDIEKALAELIAHSARLENLSHQPHLVLTGRPSSGKSTLLNSLAGYERAVVSPIPGTTRDVLSAQVVLARGIVKVSDAAGLQANVSGGTIERQMQQRARSVLEEADYVLLVRDPTDDHPWLQLPREVDLVIWTKRDLVQKAGEEMSVSAVTGQGMEELRQRLDGLCFSRSSGARLALNRRHIDAIVQARAALDRALATSETIELAAMELHQAMDALGCIVGRVTPDDLLGRIFSTFCIGK